MARRPINVLITGTPGTGKSILAAALSRRTGLNYINVGDLVKQNELHDGWNEEFQAYDLNDDKARKSADIWSLFSCLHTGC